MEVHHTVLILYMFKTHQGLTSLVVQWLSLQALPGTQVDPLVGKVRSPRILKQGQTPPKTNKTPHHKRLKKKRQKLANKSPVQTGDSQGSWMTIL